MVNKENKTSYHDIRAISCKLHGLGQIITDIAFDLDDIWRAIEEREIKAARKHR